MSEPSSILHLDPERREAVRNFLKENGLGGWIGWRPDELVLLLGHMPQWGVSVCLFPLEGQPLLVIPELEPRDHLPPETEVIAYGWGTLECRDPWAELAAILRDAIAGRKLTNYHIGYAAQYGQSSPSGCFAETPPFNGKMVERFASIAKMRESGDSFQKLYQIKTAREIQAIRLANRVAVRALEVFRQNAVPGRTEAEIAAAVESSILCETGRGEVFLARGFAFVQSGPETAASGRYNRNIGRRLEAGDAVLIEVATCVNGYWSDLTRTVFAGEARTGEHRRMFEAVREAQRLAVAAVRPGVAFGEVDRVAREALSKYAKFFTHATGHHTGIRYHDPGTGLAPGVTDRLQPGMVVTIEPGIYSQQAGAGFRIEDNVLVTETGHEILSSPAATPGSTLS